MHPPAFVFLLFWSVANLSAQVFHSSAPPPVALSLGNATLAWQNTDVGLQNEAILPFLEKKWQILGGVALPFSVGEWKSSHFSLALRPDRRSGLALGFDQSGIPNFSEQRWRLGYGRRLGQQFSIGISMNLYRIWASDYDAQFGATAAISMWGRLLPALSFAVRLQNPFFVKMEEHFLPVIFQSGICWKISEAVQFLTEIETILEKRTALKSGVSYQFTQKWWLRLGVRSAPAQFSWGTGFQISKKWRIDFAAEWHPILGMTPAGGFFWVAGK